MRKQASSTSHIQFRWLMPLKNEFDTIVSNQVLVLNNFPLLLFSLKIEYVAFVNILFRHMYIFFYFKF